MLKLLKLIDISKTYKGNSVPAVWGLNLSVKPGEIFGFLGPNGAGKTTTIKMIVGLLNPDTGRIEIDGSDISGDPIEAKMKVGFVPDNPDLYPRLTGVEYLNFIADMFLVPTSLRRERVDQLLSMFDLKSAAADIIESYSHGMKQKLALTGALLHNPKLLILDEPMVGLDPKSAHLFKELMKEHCSKGNTVFFSTHVLEVAERLCDRVGIIGRGRLIACGTLNELRNQRSSESESLEGIFLELTDDATERNE